jgi:hypothetical protein
MMTDLPRSSRTAIRQSPCLEFGGSLPGIEQNLAPFVLAQSLADFPPDVIDLNQCGALFRGAIFFIL